MEVLNNIKTAILGPITAEDLQGKSKLTLAVFEDTVKELTEINVKAIARQQEQADIIEKAVKEGKALQELTDKNSKVIGKINDILS